MTSAGWWKGEEHCIPPYPWLCCKEGGCMGGGELFRDPDSARHRGSPDLADCYSQGFSSCCKDTSSLHLSIACPGSEGVAISQPTESLHTVSIWVTSSPIEAQGQSGPAVCEQLLPALQRDASSADAAHKARKSQAKSTQGTWPIPPLHVHPSSSASSRWISGKQHPALELGMVPQDPPQNNTWSW